MACHGCHSWPIEFTDRCPARRRRRQAAQPRLRDRHPQGLDRRGRRLRGPADQGRHRRPAPRRHARAGTRASTGSAATRSSATSRRARSRRVAVQGDASLGVLPRRRRAARRTRASSWSARTPARSSTAPAGLEEENLRRVVVDLQPHQGKEIFIRLVDEHTGDWGHINFDDFRFHAEKPNFPQRPQRGRRQPDVYKYAGLPPEKAAAGDDRARGLRRSRSSPASRTCISRSPCASTTAAGSGSPRRTRYPDPPRRTRTRKDRILIFEDTDGDGKFDKRTVFMEGLNLVSGIEVGFGGVWVGAAPYLLFIPDQGRRRQARRPAARSCSTAGATRTRTRRSTPSSGARTAGSTAATASSRTRSVGKPGTPDKERMPINAGVWRYHPTQARLRGLRPRHQQSVGPRLQRPRPGLRRGLRHPALLPHHPGRPLPAAGGPALQPVHLRRHQDDRRPPPLRRRERRTAATTAPTRAGGGHAHCGLMMLPRRRLAGGVPRPALHGQHPRPAHQRGRARSRRAPATSPAHGPDFLLANDAWARFINLTLRPRRQRLPDRLVRQAGLPPRRRRRSGTAPMAASTRSATAARSR